MVASWDFMGSIPSGKRLHNYGKSHFFDGQIHYFNVHVRSLFLVGGFNPSEKYERQVG